MRRSGWKQRKHGRVSSRGTSFRAGRGRSSLSRQLRRDDPGLRQYFILRDIETDRDERRALSGLAGFPERGRNRFFGSDDVLLKGNDVETNRLRIEKAAKRASEQMESLKTESASTQEAFDRASEAKAETSGSLEDLLNADKDLQDEMKKTTASKKVSEKQSAGAYKKTLIENAKLSRFENLAKVSVRNIQAASAQNQARLARKGIATDEEAAKLGFINAERARELDNFKASIGLLRQQAKSVDTDREARLLQKKVNLARDVLERMQVEERTFQEAVSKKFLFPPGSFNIPKINLGSPINLGIGNIFRDEKTERDYARGQMSFSELGY